MLRIASHAPAALRVAFGENFDRRLGADECEPHVVGIDREGRPDIGDFERAGAGALPTSALAARRLTGSSAPLTGMPRR